MSFISFFQTQLGFLQAGRRSETVKEDATISTTTTVPLHGYDHHFRYKVGFLTDINWVIIYSIQYILTQYEKDEAKNKWNWVITLTPTPCCHFYWTENVIIANITTECPSFPTVCCSGVSDAQPKPRASKWIWFPASWLGGPQCSKWKTLFHWPQQQDYYLGKNASDFWCAFTCGTYHSALIKKYIVFCSSP